MLKLILALLLLLPTLPSSSPSPPALKRGTLVIAGGALSTPTVYSEFVKLAGEKSKILIVTTASAIEDKDPNMKPWDKSLNVCSIYGENEIPDGTTAIWFEGGDQVLLEKCYIGKPFEKKILDFYNQGGIVGGSSAGAAFMSKVMIRGGNSPDTLEMGTGLDLMPHSIVDQHFTARNRLPRLEKAVSYHPGIYGFGIDENTALIYNGSKVKVIGENCVTVLHCGTIQKLKVGEEFSYEISGASQP